MGSGLHNSCIVAMYPPEEDVASGDRRHLHKPLWSLPWQRDTERSHGHSDPGATSHTSMEAPSEALATDRSYWNVSPREFVRTDLTVCLHCFDRTLIGAVLCSSASTVLFSCCKSIQRTPRVSTQP